MIVHGNPEYEQELGKSVRRALGRRIDHRPVVLPPESLSSPTQSAKKFGTHSLCRMCQRRHSVRPTTRHHLVEDAWFRRQPEQLRRRRNAHANLVPLCRPCHDLIHAKDEFERAQARRGLRRSLSQQEIAFAIAVRGKEWFDFHYPPI